MKKLLILFFLYTGICLGQQGINYKAIISDNDAIIQNQQVDVSFTILESGTTAIYKEDHILNTDSNGLIITNIGEGVTTLGNFTAIDWSQEYFLKVEVDTGNGMVDMGTTAFKNVPYAMHAKTATTITGTIPNMGNLVKITEGINGHTGYRLVDAHPNGYGDIGSNAMDLSVQTDIPATNGATGEGAFASGINTTASGRSASVLGYQSVASGQFSIAGGYYSTASGDVSIAIGDNAIASGLRSIGMGKNITASGEGSIALGGYNTTSGIGSIAMGSNNTSSELLSIAMGSNNVASGGFSVAMGLGNIANSPMQTSIGLYCTESDVNDNRLFVIGNGHDTSYRSDAMVVLRNGNTTINGNLETKEIQSLDSGDADMKAYVYGIIGFSGDIQPASSAGFTASKLANGIYRVTFDNPPSSLEDYIVVATLERAIGFVSATRSQSFVEFRTYNTAGALSSAWFNFVIYKK